MNMYFEKISKIFLWLSGILLFLLILIFIFIQTKTFNNLALDFAVDKLNESFKSNDSEIRVASIEGNILSGLRLDSGIITVKKDTLLSFNYIDLKYDIWGILDKQIRLDHLIINSPVINLLKVKDSTDNLIWNFSKLFSSSTESDTGNSAFDWDIEVNNFKIENGSFRAFNEFQDTLTSDKKNDLSESSISKFNSDDLNITDLNLDLNVKYYNDSKVLNLRHFTFRTDSGFMIRDLIFNAGINVTDTVTQINDLKLITGRSDIKINKLLINNFNPFDSSTYIGFFEKSFEADLNFQKLDFADVRYFIPEMDMLDSSIGIVLNADGKYNDFDLRGLTLTTPDSYININGKVKNLDLPDSLYMDIVSENININPEDIASVYKDPIIQNYSDLGRVLGNLEFAGTLDNFYSKFDISTNAGAAEGMINLNLKTESYNGNLNTSGLNLGKILKDNSMKSNLNMFAKFSGSGFSLNNISSKVEYSLNNSSVAGYNVKSSGGTIGINRSNINMNVKLFSSAGNVLVRGNANIANMNHPVYSLKGSVNDLNLSAVSPGMENSDLNFSFDIKGRGIILNDINGNYNFEFDNSAYGEDQIPAIPLAIEIKNSADFKSYTVSSDAFDFIAAGDFDIESLADVMSSNINLISAEFINKLAPDTTYLTADYDIKNNYYLNENNDFTMKYSFKITDTAAANKLLSPFGILFDGEINGNALSSQESFELNSTLNINKLVYQDTAIILNNFDSDISVNLNKNLNKNLNNNYSRIHQQDENNLSSSLPLPVSFSSIDIKINSTGDKISYGKTVFDSVKINADLSESIADINISGMQDTGVTAYLNGKIDLTGNDIKAVFDSVSADYQNIKITNDKEWILTYQPAQKISFDQFNIKSKDLKLNISGEYVMNGNSDIKLSGEDILLRDVYSLMIPADSGKINSKNQYPVKGKLDKFNIEFKGDTENPDLTAVITSENLIYAGIEDDIKMGDLDINIDYKDETASADINVKNADDKGYLKITGEIPFRNPLKDSVSENMINSEFSNKNVDLKLNAKDFELKYFLKILPSLPDISGKLNGDITATGTASAPDLKGSVNIDNGNLFFAMTGMNYKFKIKTSTENSKLLINNLTLSSIDDESRHFDVFGNIDFKDMKINDIDLNTSGDMVFLDKSVSFNELGVYGYLRAGSGSPAISIKGNMDKLDIKGELLITEATISSVPLGGSGYENKIDNFTYILVSDTLSSAKDSTIILEASDFYKVNPFARYKYKYANMGSSVADFLNLDINVRTQKNIYVSIDFDNLTKDRLYGEVSVDLNLKTDNRNYAATGEVNILRNSYYRFYKDFKLRDSKISFNGPIDNPILNIQAVYEGNKTTEQFGSVSSTPVNVKLTIDGKLDEPIIALKLIEDGTEITGNDAQADAITFLLFGKYKSELSTSERTAVASSLGTSIGSLYISSIVSQTVRSILPFLVDAQFKYSEGSINDTEVEFTSELGDANITIGGKLLKEIRNFEFEIEYPLNDFLNLNLPETLLLQFSREEENNVVFGSSETSTNTGIKILYKIKY